MQGPEPRLDQAYADGRKPVSTVVVRTVQGDIAPGDLGPTDSHEHLFLATHLQPGDELSDLDRAVQEAGSLAAGGARALADWTPLGLGRNTEGLLRVSRATGLHVIAATGVHHDAHYPPDHPLRRRTDGELASQFTADITGNGVRCGLIKLGASYHRLQPFEQKAFAAAAEAHRRSRAPIGVHTEQGTMGLGIVERLRELGVPPTSVLLAHLDRNPDAAEHADTASSGAWLQFDGPGRTKYWPDCTILDLIGNLAGRGLAGQILLGGDTGRRSMMRAYGGGPGMDYVFARFKPRLERELGRDLSEQIFVDNPARAFGFAPAHRPQGPPSSEGVTWKTAEENPGRAAVTR